VGAGGGGGGSLVLAAAAAAAYRPIHYTHGIIPTPDGLVQEE